MDLPFDLDGSTKEHQGSWFSLLDLNGDIGIATRHTLVEDTLSQHAHLVDALANVKDEGGRRAFDITDLATKQIFQKHLYFCGRYEIEPGPPIHRSATAVVVHAKDHKSSERYTRGFDKVTSGKASGAGAGTGTGTGAGAGAENEEAGAVDVAAFQACMKELCAEFGVGYDAQELDRFFKACDSDRSGTISREEFQSFCEGMLGTFRNVVIKFMHNEVCSSLLY